MPGTNVKKVKAYPIPGRLKIGGADAGEARLLKITQQGFIAEVVNNVLLPGDKYEVEFKFPVMHNVITAPIVIIKIYSQFSGQSSGGATSGTPATPVADATTVSGITNSGGGVSRMIEAHFIALTDGQRMMITQFLEAVIAAGGKKG